MPGLKDIVQSFKTVDVKGVAIATPGISAEGIGYLFQRFPVIREIIGGKNDVTLTPESLSTLAPEVVAALIACGCGNVNDPEAEKAAAGLALEHQLDLLESIIGETMPSGPAPFVQRLYTMFNAGGLAVESMNIRGGK
jgi:hypothetical protein